MLKASVLFAFFFIYFSSCSQEKNANLSIKVEMQNKLHPGYADLQALKILKDGKLFKHYRADRSPSIPNEINLEKIPYGRYEFEYLNVLNQQLSKRLVIAAPKSYKVSIYPDSTNYKKNINRTMVHGLTESDTLHIWYQSTGCFHNENDSLTVTRFGNYYYLIKGGKRNLLAKRDIMHLVKFESDLMELPKNGGCTTSDSYRFVHQGRVRIYTDDTCGLDAWATLTRSLKLN